MQPQSYDMTAKALHWLMAALIVGLLAIGMVMVDLPKGGLRTGLHDIHRQVGVVVLLLAALRFGRRLWKGVPPLPEAMTGLERLAAQAGHWGLYVAMAVLPISGIVLSQAGGHPVGLLGFELPVFVAEDKALHEVGEDFHELLAYMLAALVGGHVAAALRHHFVLKDDVLARMLPWKIRS